MPTFLLGGTLDDTTPIETETTRPWAIVPARPFYRADIVGATHLAFANACDIAAALLDFGVREPDVAALVPGYYETCSDAAVLPIEVPRRIQNFYITAFFKRHLWNDPRYNPFVTVDYAEANEPGVDFFRKDAGE